MYNDLNTSMVICVNQQPRPVQHLDVLFECVSLCLSVCLLACLPVCLSVRLSICPSGCTRASTCILSEFCRTMTLFASFGNMAKLLVSASIHYT